MNKLLIVLLAVCLVGTHAFVRREAPEDNKNYLESIQNKFQEFGKTVNSQMSKAFDPDALKRNFNEFVDNVAKTIKGFKPEENAQPAPKE